MVLVTFILSNKVKAILVKVQTHKRLHLQDEIRQIKRMFDLLAVDTLNFKVLIVELDVLVDTIVHNLQVFKAYELPLFTLRSRAKWALICLIFTIHNPFDINKSPFDQMLQDLTLHLDVAHDPCGLKIFEQDYAL